MRLDSCLILLLALSVVFAITAPPADANRGVIGTFEDDLSPRGGGGTTDGDGGDPDGVGLDHAGEPFSPGLPTSRQEKSSSPAARGGGMTFRMVQLVLVTTSQLIW